jgi:hypothetical protein
MLLHTWLLSCVQSRLLFGWWSALSKCSDTSFLNPVRRPNCLLHNLQPYSVPEGLIECSPASQT